MKKTQNIKSGWTIILTIFKLAAQDTKALVEISLGAIEKIIKNDFVYIEDNFVEVVACLVKFIQNEFPEEAMKALELLDICATHLGQNNDLIDRRIKYQNLQSQESVEELREAVKKELWLPILQGLGSMCNDKREQIQQKSLELLYKQYDFVLATRSVDLWKQLFKGVIKSVLEDIDCYLENHKDDEQEKILKVISEEILKATIDLVAKQWKEGETENFSILVVLYLDIIREFIQGSKDSPLGQIAIDSLNKMIERIGEKFQTEEWKCFLTTLTSLFEDTLPVFLVGYSALFEIEDDTMTEIKDEELQEKTPVTNEKKEVCMSKCIQQLQLVLISQEIIHSHFDQIEPVDIEVLLSRLYKSYKLAHEFNTNIEMRYEMWKSGKLPLQVNTESIPRLTKQERESLRLYFKLLIKLYTTPKEGFQLNREQLVEKVLNFTIEVLGEFHSQNQKLLLIKEKLAVRGQSPDQVETGLKMQDQWTEVNKIIHSISSIISGTILDFLATGVKEEDVSTPTLTLLVYAENKRTHTYLVKSHMC